MDVRFKRCALAFGLDSRVYFLLRLCDHFLNAGRVDPAVGNELFKQDAHLAADGVKARYCDSLGRIVDDGIAAGESFDAADVAGLRGR